jgi:hypothetical protein
MPRVETDFGKWLAGPKSPASFFAAAPKFHSMRPESLFLYASSIAIVIRDTHVRIDLDSISSLA